MAKETLRQFSWSQPCTTAMISTRRASPGLRSVPSSAVERRGGAAGTTVKGGKAWGRQKEESSLISICWQLLITTTDHNKPTNLSKNSNVALALPPCLLTLKPIICQMTEKENLLICHLCN